MSEQTREKMLVEAIHNGTVIDHIPAGKGLTILGRLQLKNAEARLTVGLNLPSHGGGMKDLIKVDDWRFTEHDAAELALFAPKATVNIIEDYRVVRKFPIGLPEAFVGVFACPNANCITHVEPVESHFAVVTGESLQLRCHYCERAFADTLFIEAKV
ncbi:aspartate carbamoyltransferase regulatory subunit [Saccharospirillum sp. MSK14-1]|uniref:aspartate carbamoyltransferase regulatory subunit n=1 Tax=Saccharospirillum sp. MSK14-1 TaxID=1897632 RepID=UPI000D390F5D|nr:aspartate carbamoyltransferase regulatory subunit [Saccharospirillum sp. MSK14-1]PTY36374.1 aspartate carbamoyltransferase regulatory subunit [Saccharospirillum sp. MSK14-1]